MLENAYNNPVGTKVYTKIGDSEYTIIMDTTTICTIKEVKSYKEVKDITDHYICETEDGKIREVRDWEVVAIPDYSLPVDEMLYHYLEANGVYADVWTCLDDEHSIYVHINWGDWKHDHGLCDHLMSYLGYIKVEEDVTEENGSDCYSSTHTYEKSELTMGWLKDVIARRKAEE